MPTSTNNTRYFTRNLPHQGAWLCYINGIEIPCQSINVTYGVGMIPEATLAFPPHRYLQRLGAEDRLEVVLFYLDTLIDPEKPQFRLLFEGELMGWSYGNTAMGRTMQFQALADISIFTILYFYFMNTVESVGQYIANASLNANAFAQAGVLFPYSLFKKGLILSGDKTAEGNAPDVERPFDILYNVVQGVIGDIPDKTGAPTGQNQRTLAGVNFFSRYMRRRNFANRFAALPLFEDGTDENKGVFPILKAVQDEQAMLSIQQNLATSVGNAGSVFDSLNYVLSKLYCELAMLPTAPCFAVDLLTGKILGPSTYVTADLNKAPLRVINYFIKPQMTFGIPPTCNIIFPSMTPQIQYTENYSQQPTRFMLGENLVSQMLPASPLVADALRVGYPPEINAQLKALISGNTATPTGRSADVFRNVRDVLVFPEEFYRGPVPASNQAPGWFQLLQLKSKQFNGDKGSPAGDASSSADAIPASASLEKMFELFAQCEFYRQRYEKRGGSVSTAFNPYLVPGFPTIIFDQRGQRFDVVGYMIQVTQSLSSSQGGGSMSTSATYSFGRTLSEMLDLLKQDIGKLGILIGASPAEPIDQVRAISQDFPQAENFYGALFFGRDVPAQKKASFDFREVIGYVDRDDQPYVTKDSGKISLGTAPSVNTVTFVSPADTAATAAAAASAKAAAAGAKAPASTDNFAQARALGTASDTTVSASIPGIGIPGVPTFIPLPEPAVGLAPPDGPTKASAPVTNIDNSKIIQPLAAFADVFTSYDAAMKYVARPVCTLDEYLLFLHGRQTVAALIASGQVSGPVTGDKNPFGPTANFYARIRKLKPGPGARPIPAAIGSDVDPLPPPGGTTPGAKMYSGKPAAVDPSFPDTRTDWDALLLAYRDDVMKDKTPKG